MRVGELRNVTFPKGDKTSGPVAMSVLKTCDPPLHPSDTSDFMGDVVDGDVTVVVGTELRKDEWQGTNVLCLTKLGLGWVDVSVLGEKAR